MAQRSRELAAQGVDIINLATGEPDFDTPPDIVEAAIKAMWDGQTRYTNADGTPELKSAIIEKFKRDNGLTYTADQVVVTNGAKQAIFNAMAATLREDDEVIVPLPCWVTYPDIVRFFGASPVFVQCRAEHGFKLRPEDLEAAIGPKTRWLVLNSPCNPTGAIYSEKELCALAEVLQHHPDVWVLSDDIYEHILLTDSSFATMAAVNDDMYRRTLCVNGVSKAHCMTGWRIGYAAGPSRLARAMATVQSQTTSNSCSISQAAAIAALNADQSDVRTRNETYRARCDLVLERFEAIPGMSCHQPGGAFYLFPSCAAAIGKRTRNGVEISDDRAFAQYLLEEANVAVVCGEAYGTSPHFRISIASDTDVLAAACDRIADAWSRLT